MKPIRPDRVAIYIRWSTEDQGEGTTLEIQREGCKHYALSQGWQYNPDLVFIDDGCSGGTLDRPALTRLRRFVQDGRVDCVVVFKLDRLSRNVLDTVSLVLKEWDGRTYLKSARESVDTTTAMGKQFFYMLVNYAEWERSVIRERTHAGKLRRAQEGKNPGFRPPYGYRTGPAPGTFALCEPEADVVRLIYRRYALGAGPMQIIGRLQAEGVLFQGRPWTRATIHAVLSNPIYTGRLVFRPRGGAPVEVESPFIPPVVTPAEWNAVRQMRQGSTRPLPNAARTSPHLLTGLVRCRCGHALYPQRAYRPDGAAYYICGGQRENGRDFCTAGYIRQAELDRLICEQVAARYQARVSPAPLPDLTAAAGASAQQRAQALLAIDRQMNRAAGDYRSGRLSPEAYSEVAAQLTAEKARYRHQCEVPRATPTAADPWSALEPWQQKAVLRSLIPGLTAFRDRAETALAIEIAWAEAL